MLLQEILFSVWVPLSRFESWMAGAADAGSNFESSVVIARVSEYSYSWCTGCAEQQLLFLKVTFLLVWF